MGIYDNRIEAFTDLRSVRSLPTQKGGHVGANLDPTLAAEVRAVLEHIQAERQRRSVTNGRNRGKRKLVPGWTRVAQYWLRGDSDSGMALTVGQLCDVYSFMLQDSFWKGPGSSPEGFRRNAGKMWLSRGYARWSVFQQRPADNRPQTAATNMPPGGEDLVAHMAAVWHKSGAGSADSADLWRPVVIDLLTGGGTYGVKLSVEELRQLFDYTVANPYYSGRAWDPEVFARSARQTLHSAPYQQHRNGEASRPATAKKRITLDEASDNSWEEFYS